MASKMVRISEETDKDLDLLKNEILKDSSESKQSLVEKAVKRYVREQFIKKANADIDHFQKEDPAGFAQMMQEQDEWLTAFGSDSDE